MNESLNNPKSFEKGQGKSTQFLAQMKVVFAAFSKEPKTMLMVSVETGILRANICRYVAKWKRAYRIAVVKEDFCPLSKHRAGFYLTAPDLFSNIDTKPQKK